MNVILFNYNLKSHDFNVILILGLSNKFLWCYIAHNKFNLSINLYELNNTLKAINSGYLIKFNFIAIAKIIHGHRLSITIIAVINYYR